MGCGFDHMQIPHTQGDIGVYVGKTKAPIVNQLLVSKLGGGEVYICACAGVLIKFNTSEKQLQSASKVAQQQVADIFFLTSVLCWSVRVRPAVHHKPHSALTANSWVLVAGNERQTMS